MYGPPTSAQLRGHYSPDLLPGPASPDRPDINRPSPTTRGSVSVIESRLYALRDASRQRALDPALRAFLEHDVPWLINVASAADRWARAAQGGNAEDYRKAGDQVLAAVRSTR